MTSGKKLDIGVKTSAGPGQGRCSQLAKPSEEAKSGELVRVDLFESRSRRGTSRPHRSRVSRPIFPVSWLHKAELQQPPSTALVILDEHEPVEPVQESKKPAVVSLLGLLASSIGEDMRLRRVSGGNSG